MKYFLLILFFSSCTEVRNDLLDKCHGEFIIHKLYYKDKCLSCNGIYTLMINKESDYIYIENKTNNSIVKANYKLYKSEKNEIYLDVFNSDSQIFNGDYIIEFDTILNTIQREEYKITIESNNVYMETYKTFIKKIGN
jgi:hypothetical protein